VPNAWDSEETARSWQLIIDEAMALPDALMVAAAGEKPSNWVEYDDFTTATALRLQHWTNLQLRAICQLLRTGDTSPPAYGMIRGVIEVWAHLHWIYNRDDKASWECRAMRVALMLAEEGFNSIQGMNPEWLEAAGLVDSIAARREAVVLLREMMRERDCKPQGGRKRSGAEASVKEIATQQSLDWLMPMWRQSSLVVHPLSIEWILEDLGDGRSAIATPPLSQMAARLDHALTAFTNAGNYFLALVGSEDRIEPFNQAVRTFRARPFVMEAMAGSRDATLEARLAL
jgi:hypothetical protein